MEKVLPQPSTQLARLLFPRGPSPATSTETAAKCICSRGRKRVQPGRLCTWLMLYGPSFCPVLSWGVPSPQYRRWEKGSELTPLQESDPHHPGQPGCAGTLHQLHPKWEPLHPAQVSDADTIHNNSEPISSNITGYSPSPWRVFPACICLL